MSSNVVNSYMILYLYIGMIHLPKVTEKWLDCVVFYYDCVDLTSTKLSHDQTSFRFSTFGFPYQNRYSFSRFSIYNNSVECHSELCLFLSSTTSSESCVLDKLYSGTFLSCSHLLNCVTSYNCAIWVLLWKVPRYWQNGAKAYFLCLYYKILRFLWCFPLIPVKF